MDLPLERNTDYSAARCRKELTIAHPHPAHRRATDVNIWAILPFPQVTKVGLGYSVGGEIQPRKAAASGPRILHGVFACIKENICFLPYSLPLSRYLPAAAHIIAASLTAAGAAGRSIFCAPAHRPLESPLLGFPSRLSALS